MLHWSGSAAIATASTLLTVFGLSAGCSSNTKNPASGGTGGTSGAAGGSGTGGTVPADCADASQCEGLESECGTRTCIGGKCGKTYTAADTALSAQVAGDCKLRVCDGKGGIIEIPLDNDVPDDGNECTKNSCSAGEPVGSPEPVTTTCGSSASTHCDGAGKCIGCTTKSECPADTACVTYACTQNQCVATNAAASTPCGNPATCSNGEEYPQDECDGTGTCTDVLPKSCGPYVCGATACKTTCAGDTDCGNTSWCNGTACVPKKANGQPCSKAKEGTTCSGNHECLSGSCKNNPDNTTVCCDALCDGACRTCLGGTCKGVTASSDPYSAGCTCSGSCSGCTYCSGKC